MTTTEKSVSAGDTVYDRCGGYEGMLRIACSILELHHDNPILEVRYGQAKKSDDELARLVAELLSSVTGGSETYTGMTMLEAHTGMNCSEQEFLEVLDDIMKALEINGVGKPDQDTILGLNYGLKPDIVRR